MTKGMTFFAIIFDVIIGSLILASASKPEGWDIPTLLLAIGIYGFALLPICFYIKEKHRADNNRSNEKKDWKCYFCQTPMEGTNFCSKCKNYLNEEDLCDHKNESN